MYVNQPNFTDINSNENRGKANRYSVNRESENSSPPSTINKKALIIIVAIAVVVALVLVIVLPIVLTRKSDSTTTNPQPVTSPNSYLTKCQSIIPRSSPISSTKTASTKVKIYNGPPKIGNSIRLENTYVVEFNPGSNEKNFLSKISKSLRSSNIQYRSSISTAIFSGVSFTINDEHSIESFELIQDAVAVYPVYTVQLPKPIRESSAHTGAYDGNYATINSYNLTRVEQVHKTLKNYGAGIKVAVIDSGVYYKHPALGGCFGEGCKVAFGFDFIGNGDPRNPLPDDDPIDNCSSDSHGTHVAGIIAANTTGITEKGFISPVPFMGIAPQATIGAYRVMNCADQASTDIIAQAIYRAYNDGADVINLSMGFPGPYPDTLMTLAIQRVVERGVYVVVAASNDGDGGFQTSDDPAVSPSDMSVASVDNNYYLSTLYSLIFGPNSTTILYVPGGPYGQWRSIINSTIVVNNASATVDDGCYGPVKSVLGSVVLFYETSSDSCTSTERCDLAAKYGAIGCLFYNSFITGGTFIPSGSISSDDASYIIAQTTTDPSTLYTFTNLAASEKLDKAGTPSSFSSLGPSGDLFFEPQISGIGGLVFSTISPYAAYVQALTTMYEWKSGTSMACPYVAGTLALFLSNIGNPSPRTVNGQSENGKCRPPFSFVKSIFQSTSKPVKIYNTSYLSTTIQQGSGLVDIYHAIKTTTVISPSELSLNDTIRKAQSYKVKVYNIGSKSASYKVSHVGAALATGKSSQDDQLLAQPIYSPDYASVNVDPSEFSLDGEQSRELTIQFTSPTGANPLLLPIYSGFIYVTNQNNGESVHLSYAGMVGDYENARIIVQNTSNEYTTGIVNMASTMNATEQIEIRVVLAWSTRIVFIEIVTADNTLIPGINSSHGILRMTGMEYTLYSANSQRNTQFKTQSFSSADTLSWNGFICPKMTDLYCSDSDAIQVPEGEYQIRYSVLKHFGNSSNPSDFETYLTPRFYLVY